MSLDLSKIKIVDVEEFFAVSEGFIKDFTKDPKIYIKKVVVPKKDRTQRIVFEALGTLSDLHRVFQYKMEGKFEIHSSVFGYKKNKGTKENAQLHLGKKTVVKVDIKDFFNSIKESRVQKVLEKIGFQQEIAELITPLFCTNKTLEAGFCPSPLIANAACFELDINLHDWANQNDIVYSRYSDDITLSTDRRLDFSLDKVEEILDSFSLKLNNNKTKFMFRGEPQYVTGLSVTESDKVRTPQSFKKNIEKDLYFIKKFGIEDHISHKYKNLSPTPSRTAEIYTLFGNIGYIKGIEPPYISKLREKKLLPPASDFQSFFEFCCAKNS